MRIETKRLVITDFRSDMARAVHLGSLDEDTRRFLPDEVFETEEIAAEHLKITQHIAAPCLHGNRNRAGQLLPRLQPGGQIHGLYAHMVGGNAVFALLREKGFVKALMNPKKGNHPAAFVADGDVDGEYFFRLHHAFVRPVGAGDGIQSPFRGQFLQHQCQYCQKNQK
jgi:hypothetical protein